jgi:outer membrane autotransporter protein
MKTKDWLSQWQRQSIASPLVNLFSKTICRNTRIESPRKDPCTDWFRPVARRNARAQHTENRPRTRRECWNITSLKTTKQRLVVATGVVALNIILTGIVFGQTTWTGNVSSDWLVPGNWSPATVPTAADNVTINTNTPHPTILEPLNGVATGAASTLSLGASGAGNLTIQNGASLATGTISTLSAVDSIGGSSPGTVTVTGSNSNWTNNAPFLVGLTNVGSGNALGMLNIENGASVNNSTGIVAAGSGAGMVTVSGMGSTWTNRDLLFVGDNGQGALAISNGGAVSSGGDIRIAVGSSSSGTVTVNDSIMSSGGIVFVGFAGAGNLTISNGGMVTDGTGEVSDQAGSVSTATVTGSGSAWQNGLFTVGVNGTGTLIIANSGTVSSTQGFVGANAGSDGTVMVTGGGSTWTSTGALTVGRLMDSQGTINVMSGGTLKALDALTVGNEGTGTLNITNGGLVSVSGGDSVLGNVAGSSGKALVTGAGSIWDNFGNIVVGNAGTGTLIIQDNGLVQTAGTIFVADAGGTGTINALNGTIQTVGGITIRGVGTVSLDQSTLIATSGDAFRIENGGNATISINNVDNTIQAGSGNLLNVIGSTATLTVMNSTLSGNILADATSSANVSLQTGSILTGAVNPNQLTGATGINPNELIPPTVIPPQTVILSVDGTSTWNMTQSSTLNMLNVALGARVFFTDPPGDPFKTLIVNNLTGSGGLFRLNNDLGAVKGDLLTVLTSSAGGHVVTFNDVNGSDLPANVGLLAVQTADGKAIFVGAEDGGTYVYVLKRGRGDSIIPNPNDWYLVRGDQQLPPSPLPPPPEPSPLPVPPDDIPTGPLSPLNDLTASANAAIGMFSAAMPLFYADMDTLVERLGELRLGVLPPPAPAPYTPAYSKEGKQIVAPPPPEAPPSGGGVWVRGFGSQSHIDNQASLPFDQELGGFQIGADKRLITKYGDLYLGGFVSYYHASEDFHGGFFSDMGSGDTEAFSVGGYTTLIHPSGFYLDGVVKYTQLWNNFDVPNILSRLGLGPTSSAYYSIPIVGGSLEIGKRWDFGHFFVEPQGQIMGAFAGGRDYTVSTGLNVHDDSQASLRGRLGVRAGCHLDCGTMAFEPYGKVSVVNEFLGGYTVTTDQNSFFPTTSGVAIQAAAGLAARLSNAIYLYGEYDYYNSEKLRTPWSFTAGLRWQW